MKMLTAVLMLILAFSSFATTDSKTFVYDGSEDSIQLNLLTAKTHTEYRYEQRHSICYRQEVFYHTVCHNTPQGRFCNTVPQYRTISYPCIETVRIPYEVKDYDVDAKVMLSVTNASEVMTPGETFKATLNGDQLTLSAVGSKKFFIVLKKQDVRSEMSGSVKFIDASYTAELVEAAPIVKALDVTNISMKNNVLTFKTGPVEARDQIGFSLNVSKNPVLGSSTVLFDRELRTSEILLNSSATGADAQVDMQKLGVELTSGRHTLTAKTFFKAQGKILNEGQFERIEASRTLIYKIR